MAIKKESAEVTPQSGKLKDKKNKGLIRGMRDPKEKQPEKNYEGGIDPQDEQLNTMPEDSGENQGDIKPGGGNRLHKDRSQGKKKS